MSGRPSRPLRRRHSRRWGLRPRPARAPPRIWPARARPQTRSRWAYSQGSCEYAQSLDGRLRAVFPGAFPWRRHQAFEAERHPLPLCPQQRDPSKRDAVDALRLGRPVCPFSLPMPPRHFSPVRQGCYRSLPMGWTAARTLPPICTGTAPSVRSIRGAQNGIFCPVAILANARRSTAARNGSAWSRRYGSGLRDRSDVRAVPGFPKGAAESQWLWHRNGSSQYVALRGARVVLSVV